MDKAMERVHAFVDRPGALGPPWTDGGADRGGLDGSAGTPKLTGGGRNRERSAWGARLGPYLGLGSVEEDRRRW
jgi:hypothetical protein